jgi:hypothetical protein
MARTVKHNLTNKEAYEIFFVKLSHLKAEEKVRVANEMVGADYGYQSWYKKAAAYRESLSEYYGDDVEEKLAAKHFKLENERRKVNIYRYEVNKGLNKLAFVDEIREVLKDIQFPTYEFEDLPIVDWVEHRPVKSGEWYLLIHADLHYDGSFDLYDYFQELYDIVVQRNIQELTIFGMGDEIEGLLRPSAAMYSVIGAVEQMRDYAVAYLNFLQRLSQICRIHVFQLTSSNHTETRVLNTGRSELPEEDLLKLLDVVLQIGLANNPNATYLSGDNIHKTIGNHDFYLEHGHNIMKDKKKNYIEKIMADRLINVDYFYFAHLHRYENQTLHARDGYDADFTVAPSAKPYIGNYERRLLLSSNPAVLLEKFDDGGRVWTEKVLLKYAKRK